MPDDINNEDISKMKMDLGVGAPEDNAALLQEIRADVEVLNRLYDRVISDVRNITTNIGIKVHSLYPNTSKEERYAFLKKHLIAASQYDELDEMIEIELRHIIR